MSDYSEFEKDPPSDYSEFESLAPNPNALPEVHDQGPNPSLMAVTDDGDQGPSLDLASPEAQTHQSELERRKTLMGTFRSVAGGIARAAPFKEELPAAVDALSQPGKFSENYYKNRDANADFWDKEKELGGDIGDYAHGATKLSQIPASLLLPGGPLTQMAIVGGLEGLDASEGRVTDLAHGDLSGVAADVGQGAGVNAGLGKTFEHFAPVAVSGIKKAATVLRHPIATAENAVGGIFQTGQKVLDKVAEKVGPAARRSAARKGFGDVKITGNPDAQPSPMMAALQRLRDRPQDPITGPLTPQPGPMATPNAEAAERVAGRDAEAWAREQARKANSGVGQAERDAAQAVDAKLQGPYDEFLTRQEEARIRQARVAKANSSDPDATNPAIKKGAQVADIKEFPRLRILSPEAYVAKSAGQRDAYGSIANKVRMPGEPSVSRRAEPYGYSYKEALQGEFPAEALMRGNIASRPAPANAAALEAEDRLWNAGQDAMGRTPKLTPEQAAMYGQMTPEQKAAFVVPRPNAARVERAPIRPEYDPDEAERGFAMWRAGKMKSKRMDGQLPESEMSELDADNMISRNMRKEGFRTSYIDKPDTRVYRPDPIQGPPKPWQDAANDTAVSAPPSVPRVLLTNRRAPQDYAAAQKMPPKPYGDTYVTPDNPRIAASQAQRKAYASTPHGEASRRGKLAEEVAAVNDEIAARGTPQPKANDQYVQIMENADPALAARNAAAERSNMRFERGQNAKANARASAANLDSLQAGERLQNIRAGRDAMHNAGPTMGAVAGLATGGIPGAIAGGLAGRRLVSSAMGTADVLGNFGQKLSQHSLKTLNQPGMVQKLSLRPDTIGAMAKWAMSGSPETMGARTYILANQPAFREAMKGNENDQPAD